MTAIGIDIGGANVKLSDGVRSRTVPFPLWKQPGSLQDVLRGLLEEHACAGPLAVTMTGELADCFRTKREGVHAILRSVERAAAPRTGRVWCTAGEFLSFEEAREFPSLVAAANWHALATWAGRMTPAATSLLIDVGTTTSDLIPIKRGTPLPAGRTDLERLASGELIYLGVRRTPVCSIVSELPLRGTMIPVARELFSTALDVRLLLGLVEEAPADRETANGRPATRGEALHRLARQVCCDLSELSGSEVVEMARHVHAAQRQRIAEGLQRVLHGLGGLPQSLLFSGEGESLAREAIAVHQPTLCGVENLSLARLLGPEHSRAACAFALSRLGAERP